MCVRERQSHRATQKCGRISETERERDVGERQIKTQRRKVLGEKLTDRGWWKRHKEKGI